MSEVHDDTGASASHVNSPPHITDHNVGCEASVSQY